MASYKPTRVVSIRIESELLDAVRQLARVEGRSLSGEIVFMLRDRVKAQPLKRQQRPITGWLRKLQAPKSHAEFRQARNRASEDVLRAVRRKARTA
jgi:hypothetical protein